MAEPDTEPEFLNGTINSSTRQNINETYGRPEDNRTNVPAVGYGSIQSGCSDRSNAVISQATMPYRIKLIKTCCMLLIYIGLGVWCGVVSPTMVDITDLYSCTYDAFVRATTMKPVGVMAGSFIGAAIADRLRAKADLPMFIAILVGGLSCLAVPWAPNLVVMGIFWFINGLSHGTLNVLCNSLCIAIWGTSAATPIHALHMMFTIGVTISPPVIVPFLTQDDNNTTAKAVNHTTDYTSMFSINNELEVNSHLQSIHHIFGDWTEIQQSYAGVVSKQNNTSSSTAIRIPYAIFGGWGILISLIFLLFFLSGSTYTSTTVKKRESLKQMLNFGAIAGGDVKYGLYFVISLFFLYIFIQGRDGSAAMFIFVIANKGNLHMSKPISALLVTICNLCTAIGRALSGLLSRWVNIQLLLFSQLILACIVQVLLIFFYGSSMASFWTLVCLSGLFMGPTYPSVMSWTDHYIEATGVVIAIIDIGIGTGAFVSLWISGALFQRHGAQSVFIVGAVFGVCVMILLIPLQIVASFKGNRHNIKIDVPERTVTNNNNEKNDEKTSLIT